MPPKVLSNETLMRDIGIVKRYEEIKKQLSPEMRKLPVREAVRRFEEGVKQDRHNKGRAGRRKDLGMLYVRSLWEANYARFLTFCIRNDIAGIRSWEYEPKEFEFPVKRGNRFYRPDFKVYFEDGHYEWHEVKGWFTPDSKTKINRFNKYFPEEWDKLKLITSVEMKNIEQQFSSIIPYWNDEGL